ELDEPGVEQHLDMLGDGGLGQRQAVGDVGAAAMPLLAGQDAQNLQAHGVPQGSHNQGYIVVAHCRAIASVNYDRRWGRFPARSIPRPGGARASPESLAFWGRGLPAALLFPSSLRGGGVGG